MFIFLSCDSLNEDNTINKYQDILEKVDMQTTYFYKAYDSAINVVIESKVPAEKRINVFYESFKNSFKSSKNDIIGMKIYTYMTNK